MPDALIKPTHKAIKQYYQSLKDYSDQKVIHEGALETAFGRLLADIAKLHHCALIPKNKLKVGKHTIFPDGTVRETLYDTRLGYWEAKDLGDNLDREISLNIAKGYPLNNTIFVTVAMDPTTATVGVADNAGNTYSNDEDVTNGSSTAGVRTLVFSAPVAHALTSGTITVTFTGTIPALKAATFFSFPDLLVPVKDRNQHGIGTTTNTNKVADSGYTTSLAQRNELLIGAMGFEDRNITFTPGAGYSAVPFSSADVGGNAQDNITMEPEYKLVRTTDQGGSPFVTGWNASGQDNQQSRNWAAAIVTYKQAVPSVSSITLADANPHGAGTVHFTVTFNEPVYGVSASDFSLAAAGLTGFGIDSVTGSDASYTVTAHTGTTDATSTHTLGLNLVDHDTIVDVDDVPIGGEGSSGFAGDGSFTGPVYTLSAPTTLTVATASGTYAGTANLSATLTKSSDSSALSGKNISFTLNGNSVGSASTNASGVATLSPDASLSGSHDGEWPKGPPRRLADSRRINAGTPYRFRSDPTKICMVSPN